MPRKKQKLTEKPTEEAIRKLFPKKAVDKMKEVAHENDDIEGDKNGEKE
jgi:hypothetical protein